MSESASTRPTAVAVAGAALLALAGFAVDRYALRGSSFCGAACHADNVMAGASAHRHPELDCEACHPTELGVRLQLGWQALVGRGDSAPGHGSVDDRLCVECHETSTYTSFRLVAATRGHRAHPAASLSRPCLDCHGADEHHAGAIETTCFECHERDRLHAADAATAERPADDPDRCAVCHSFSPKTDEGARPVVVECASCHGESGAPRPARAQQAAVVSTAETQHGQVDCRLCHNPHGHDRQGEQGGHNCPSCHDIDTGHREVVPAGHRVCESCHQPHASHRDAVVSCDNCHSEAEQSGRTGSVALRHEACSSCHLPHRWVAERAGCVKCHDDTATVLQAASPPEHGVCTDCHEPHDRGTATAQCAACHPAQRGHETEAPEAHQQCAACHEPHAANARPTQCQDCHGGSARELGDAGVDAHRQPGCRGCHRSHGRAAAGAGSCGACHEAEQAASAAAGPADHQRCGACHSAHAFTVGSMETLCATCHRTVVAAGGSHRGDCQSCHPAHGAAAVPAKTCIGCHADVKTDAAKTSAHADCSSCHQAHASAKAAAGLCTTCHQVQQRDALSWPAGSPHRAGCETCHPAHDVNSGPSCASCHVNEGAQARGDDHRCSHCHSAHRAPSGDRAQYWTDCEGCHTAQATGARSRGPTHAGCANCHAPHSFKSPSCTSCHGDVTKLGSHAHRDHRACERCHEPHSRVSVKRRHCLGCHTDQRNHEPDAPRCQACHPFK